MSALQAIGSSRLTLSRFDPITDSRWDELLLRQPRASVFHTRAWLRALQRAYGYEPLAYAMSSPGESLGTTLLFCRVKSRISGNRLVSLPFSDHCDALAQNEGELAHLLNGVVEVEQNQSKYIELRSLAPITNTGFSPAQQFVFHDIDLSPGAEQVYARFHRDCIQRKIRRAEREKLSIKSGNSRQLLMEFYRLHVQNRKRLGVLPQPISWFEALSDEMSTAMDIYVAYHQQQPVASIVVLRSKATLVYKYGASDPEFNAMGGVQALMWRAIETACTTGATVFDLGRSDADQTGLIEFKDRWGARKSLITYYRNKQSGSPVGAGHLSRLSKAITSALPARILPLLSRGVYRHAG